MTWTCCRLLLSFLYVTPPPFSNVSNARSGREGVSLLINHHASCMCIKEPLNTPFTGCKSYFREFFNGSQFQNCWELSLQIWVGRSLNIPFEVIQNNFLIPATIIEKFRFSQERCRTCRAPCFLNLSGNKPEF